MKNYAVVYEAPMSPGGNWSAYVPDLPGLASAGDTLEECQTNVAEGIRFHIEGLRRFGYPVPEPTTKVGELAVAA